MPSPAASPTFRTLCRPAEAPRFISHSEPLLTLGSCFADEVASRMRAGLFAITSNPLGTLYNPASIAACARRLAEGREFAAADLFEHLGRLHTFHAHSSLSTAGTTEQALARLNAAVALGHRAIRSAATVVITLGTAYVFETTGDNPAVVANCHKLPASRFRRFRLTAAEAAGHILAAIDAVRSVNPGARIILTVSPIRHLADGLHGNTLSKSTLMLAADEACRSRDEVHYFEAYEALCDDLRDYRFYAPDMVHPSGVAVDYIYSLFSEAFIAPGAVEAARECSALTAAMAHRTDAGASATPEQQRFEEHLSRLRASLLEKYPYICSIISDK